MKTLEDIAREGELAEETLIAPRSAGVSPVYAIKALRDGVAGATGLGAAKLAANAGKLGQALITAGEIGANGVTAGSIAAAGEAVSGGDAAAGFTNGAIGGAVGTGAGKLLEAVAPGATQAGGQKIAEVIDNVVHFPKGGAAPSVANGEAIGEVVGEVVGNTAGAVTATSTCAVVNDPC